MGLRDKFTQGAPAPPGYEVEPDEGDSPISEASDDPVSAEIDALARKKLKHRMGVRRELKSLRSILNENERVLSLAAGHYEDHQGLIVMTERRLIFYEKGMARSRQEYSPYSKVSSIQTKTGMAYGGLTIYVSGNKAHLSHVLPKERVGEIGEYVRSRISDHYPTETPRLEGSAAPLASPEDRLRRLQAMLESDLISQDEYAAKRREILAEL